MSLTRLRGTGIVSLSSPENNFFEFICMRWKTCSHATIYIKKRLRYKFSLVDVDFALTSKQILRRKLCAIKKLLV